MGILSCDCVLKHQLHNSSLQYLVNVCKIVIDLRCPQELSELFY